MHFLYPSHPLRKRLPEDQYREEAEAAEAAGFAWSVFSLEDFQEGTFRTTQVLNAGSEVVYRGWMLNGGDYSKLATAVASTGARLKVTPMEYLAHHHLPNWYPLIADLTPETKVFGLGADLESALRALAWDGFFIKDYVKSLKTSVGSRITNPAQVQTVIQEMQRFRGAIEGGICVRRIEDFDSNTEQRCFAINGRAYAESGPVPEVVSECAGRFSTDFISIDSIRRRDGTLRIVEIGDGQVSDLVGWTPGRFTEVLKEAWKT